MLVIEYEASWCGPCKEFRPRVVAASELFPNLRFYRFDTDKEEGPVLSDLGLNKIRSVPTLVLYRTGRCAEEMARFVGCANQAALVQFLEKQ